MTPVRCLLQALAVILFILAALAAYRFSGPQTAKDPDSFPDAAAHSVRRVLDSRGEEVMIPVPVKTVATISDGLVEEVMIALDVGAEVIAIGSTCLVREFAYDFVSRDGETFSYAGGMNPANLLMPSLRKRPFFIKPGTEMNFETLVKAGPDVLIVQAGCCTINWRAGDDRKMNSTLARLKSLGIPTVVLHGPNFSGNPDIRTLSENIEIIGQVFGKEKAARKLSAYLEAQVRMVSDRTRGIPETMRPRVLLFGLNPNARRSGASGTAFGRLDIQSYMLEEIVHARNAFAEDCYSRALNAEQVLALDPDVFILPTSNGYHPPRELTDTADFSMLGELAAIRENRVVALPWSPCNCDQRLEYPVNVMVMAKASYPQLFSDIALESWLIGFFKEVYRVDDRIAGRLIDVLWLDWVRSKPR